MLVSAVLFGGLPGELLTRALRGEIELVTSAALMDELEGVLANSFSLDGAFVRSVRAELELIAEVVSPPEVSRVTRDPDYDVVLAAAVVGGVSMIVTGDGDLLVLEEHRGIRIVTPRDFA